MLQINPTSNMDLLQQLRLKNFSFLKPTVKRKTIFQWFCFCIKSLNTNFWVCFFCFIHCHNILNQTLIFKLILQIPMVPPPKKKLYPMATTLTALYIVRVTWARMATEVSRVARSWSNQRKWANCRFSLSNKQRLRGLELRATATEAASVLKLMIVWMMR